MTLKEFLPCIIWLRSYNRQDLSSDILAALIVTVMLIPQSLAYALLAGVPPEVGLYASMLPLLVYAVFGTSRTLSVGPVAIASLMTAEAVGRVAAPGSEEYLQAAVVLAMLSGLFLLALGLLRAGFLSNFLSHPVISGFISASAVLIAFSQLRPLLGVPADHTGTGTFPQFSALLDSHLPTLILGLAVLLFLFWARFWFADLLIRLGLKQWLAELLARAAPALMVIASSLVAYFFDLQAQGVTLVGVIPSGLPAPTFPAFDPAMWRELLIPAMLISIIGYVESISVGKTLGAKRRQRVKPDQELVALGVANIASSVSGAFPVTGGFARSVVNFDAGARTPAAGAFTAVGIMLVALFLTDMLAWLPVATLAATIIVAVLSLIELSILRKTWRYSRSDFAAVAITIAITLVSGVEAGVLWGVVVSISLHIYKTSRPHIAEVGRVRGTEHFRNVMRHPVQTHGAILSLRVDESLYFPNAAYLEDAIYQRIADRPGIHHVVLMCTAVNEIDFSALEVLAGINQRLRELAIGFHLSEVKGPVMDALQHSDLLTQLNGKVYLSQHEAMDSLSRQ